MNGTVTNICTNQWGNRTFGFILGDDGVEYFFHKKSLVRIAISSLQKMIGWNLPLLPAGKELEKWKR